MKVSIAVPCRNYAQYMDACLGSIQRQTHSDFEVLIADGGSSDDTLKIAERYCANDPRFRIVSREDRGQADAVNKALRLAQGAVLGYLNADDTYVSDSALEIIVRAFTAHPEAQLISASGSYIDADGGFIRPVRLRYHPLDSPRWMKYRTAVLQPGTFWRRNVFDALQFDDRFHYAFDAMFFYEAYKRYAWVEIPDVIAGYRLHGANKSISVRYQRIRELARFEEMKFGASSLRAKYLNGIAQVAIAFDAIPVLGRPLNRMLYLAVNSLSFATAYRLPGI